MKNLSAFDIFLKVLAAIIGSIALYGIIKFIINMITN